MFLNLRDLEALNYWFAYPCKLKLYSKWSKTKGLWLYSNLLTSSVASMEINKIWWRWFFITMGNHDAVIVQHPTSFLFQEIKSWSKTVFKYDIRGQFMIKIGIICFVIVSTYGGKLTFSLDSISSRVRSSSILSHRFIQAYIFLKYALKRIMYIFFKHIYLLLSKHICIIRHISFYFWHQT